MSEKSGPVSNSKEFSRKRTVMRQLECTNNEQQTSGKNSDNGSSQPIGEEDAEIWTDQQDLFTYHLEEILKKWSKIDDEIWGKLICMQENRRVAKAYARAPILAVDGSTDGFDGFRVGLAGFDNPKMSNNVQTTIEQIGKGIKLKMDQEGNVFIKNMSTVGVSVRAASLDFQAAAQQSTQLHCLSTSLANNKGLIGPDEAVKAFDMKRFARNIATELSQGNCNRRKLELQCVINICFGSGESGEQLMVPCWVMLINIVALDMLRSQLPHEVYASAKTRRHRKPNDQMENVKNGHLLTPRDEQYPRLVRGRIVEDAPMTSNSSSSDLAQEYPNQKTLPAAMSRPEDSRTLKRMSERQLPVPEQYYPFAGGLPDPRLYSAAGLFPQQVHQVPQPFFGGQMPQWPPRTLLNDQFYDNGRQWTASQYNIHQNWMTGHNQIPERMADWE